MTEPTGTDYQVEADRLLDGVAADVDPAERAIALTVLANRLATRLHNLGRDQAAATKGEPEWPNWASLQNAARKLVLEASSARDVAARLAGRRR
jgi:hypothetical protein